jgi:DNA-binding NtrC family response regulator
MSYLTEQRWPGNVRQLRHEVERAFVFAEDGRITADILARYGDGWSQPQDREVERAGGPPENLSMEPTTMKDALAQVEVGVIRQAMARHKGNKKRVASELGISRSYLYKMLEVQNAS